MILMVLVLAACSCFTYGYAKEQAQSNAIDSIKSQFGEMPGGNKPDFGNSENGEDSAEFSQTPPEMPSDNGENSERPERPDGAGRPGENQNGNTDNAQPPEMPDNGSESQDSGESENGPNKSENGPDKNGAQQTPEGEQQEANGEQQEADGRQNRMGPTDFSGNMPDMGGSASAQIDTPFIIILGIENLVLAAVIIHLLLSGFNKRGFKKTLKNTKNAIIFTMSVLIIAGGITFAQFAASGRTEIPFDGRPSFNEEQTPPELPDENESATNGQSANEASISI